MSGNPLSARYTGEGGEGTHDEKTGVVIAVKHQSVARQEIDNDTER